MTMELALKAVKLGSLGGRGNIMPADRVGSGLGLSVACKRLKICMGSTYGGSLRLVPVTCSDSAQSPAPARCSMSPLNLKYLRKDLSV